MTLNLDLHTLKVVDDQGVVYDLQEARKLFDEGRVTAYNTAFAKLVACDWDLNKVKEFYGLDKYGQRKGDMTRDVDVKIEPVKPSIPESNLKDINELSTETQESGDKDSGDAENRVKQVVEDVERLKTAIQNYLMSSYKLKLSDDELDDLLRKILSALSNIVADITSERVESLAESAEVLKPKETK